MYIHNETLDSERVQTSYTYEYSKDVVMTFISARTLVWCLLNQSCSVRYSYVIVSLASYIPLISSFSTSKRLAGWLAASHGRSRSVGRSVDRLDRMSPLLFLAVPDRQIRISSKQDRKESRRPLHCQFCIRSVDPKHAHCHIHKTRQTLLSSLVRE